MGEYGTNGDGTRDQYSVNTNQQPDWGQYSQPQRTYQHRNVPLHGGVQDNVKSQPEFGSLNGTADTTQPLRAGTNEVQIQQRLNAESQIHRVPVSCIELVAADRSLPAYYYYKSGITYPAVFVTVDEFQRRGPTTMLYDGNGDPITPVPTNQIAGLWALNSYASPITLNIVPRECYSGMVPANRVKTDVQQAERLYQKYRRYAPVVKRFLNGL